MIDATLPPMRILLLNPNTTTAMTDRLLAAAVPVVAPGTTLVPLTATRGVAYISNRAEAQIAGAVAIEMLAEHHHEVDAAIIAAFGDPGLFGARELFEIPVIGMAEAAMHTACLLGRRFAIVTFAPALAAWFGEIVAMHGLADRCVAIRSLDGSFRSASDVAEEKEALLLELAQRAVSDDRADVLVLAGAPLAGLAGKVRDRLSVPVVDQVQAAVKQAEAVLALHPRKATAGSFRRPAPKPTSGLGEALARRIEHRDH
jgi:allantoin racemase